MICTCEFTLGAAHFRTNRSVYIELEFFHQESMGYSSIRKEMDLTSNTLDSCIKIDVVI